MESSSQFIDGVTKFSHSDRLLDKCSTCLDAKQSKNLATGTTLKATCLFQGFFMDFYFSGVCLKNSDHEKDFLVAHGKTCWLLMTNHFSKYI